MKWSRLLTVIPLAYLATACAASGGDDVRADNAARTIGRDLTLVAAAAHEIQAISALELGASPILEGDPHGTPNESASEVSDAPSPVPLLMPVAVRIPEVERVLRPGVFLAARPVAAPLGVSTLQSGQTIGAPTPHSIHFTRPGSATEPLPEDYYRWPGEAAAAPRPGVIIAIGGGGGTCNGPGRGAFVRPTLPRF